MTCEVRKPCNGRQFVGDAAVRAIQELVGKKSSIWINDRRGIAGSLLC